MVKREIIAIDEFETGYQNYLFEPGGGAKLPYTLKNPKNAYIPTKLSENEVIKMKFWK